MNPIEILKGFMTKGGNPQELLQRTMGMNNNNPVISNLVSLAKNGDKEQVEKIARNICKERGINYDEEFPKFMKQIKG